MKEQKLNIQINKPIKDVFEFTLDPANTPKWINAVVSEQTNEWPAKLGTIYRNQNKNGEWRELEITTFELNKKFVLSTREGFHVGYTFTPLDENTTKLEYTLRMDKGELKVLMTIEVLEKLKKIIEAES